MTALSAELPSVLLLAGISDNLPPVLFLVLLGLCALLIVVGALVDILPEREPGDAANDDQDKAKSASSKADKKKAKAEAKARKREEQARKKEAKAAAKGKKSKGATANAPAASEAATSSEESLDFSMPDEE